MWKILGHKKKRELYRGIEKKERRERDWGNERRDEWELEGRKEKRGRMGGETEGMGEEMNEEEREGVLGVEWKEGIRAVKGSVKCYSFLWLLENAAFHIPSNC